MQNAGDVRLVAVNIGVRSKEELNAAVSFWEDVLAIKLEDWDGRGRSRQARVGSGGNTFYFNLRLRAENEAHFGHRAAFGIAVPDLEAFRERALTAGAIEDYPPTETEQQPKHFLLHDPIGNSVVIWQG